MSVAPPSLDVAGKTALVCGSTQGIGRAAAVALAAAGARVVLLARNEESLKKTLGALANAALGHSYLVADFSKPADLEARLAEALPKFSPIHILVNNTGGPPGGALVEAKAEAFLEALAAHLLCNHALVKAVLPGMRDARFGRIINIISTSVKQPISGLGVSNTVRGAVANWAKTLAGEVGSFGITVNNVLPGFTETERLKTIIANKMTKTGLAEAAVVAEMVKEVPLARFASPEEIANAVVFLASRQASYISGINLPVDGGRTACL